MTNKKRRVKKKVSTSVKRETDNKNKSKLRIILICAILFVGAVLYFDLIDFSEFRPVEGQIEVHFIDVGQADATLIITEAGTMLIDAGSRSSGHRVVEYLQEMGITEITYVVATHPHEDHIGGMDLVLNAFNIGTVLMPAVSHTTLTYERMIAAIENNNITVRAPNPGDIIRLGDAVFTVIHPNSDNNRNLNDWSISFRMQFGGVSMVTTGDAEGPAEREMMENGHILSADILRIGHHGSRTSTTQEFFDAVSPSIAIIQVGADNRYGHPHECVMDRLNAAGVRIYRNDHHGDIILTTDGTNIDIRTTRGTITSERRHVCPR